MIIKNSVQGKPIVDKERWEEYKADMKKISWKDELKQTTPWLLLALFCLAIGFFMGSYIQAEIATNYINTRIIYNETFCNYTALVPLY